MEIIIAICLGLVEGITEFLPISSTGHLILVGNLLGFKGEKAATFEIFIQLGAILAVFFLYRPRFLSLLNFKSDPPPIQKFSGWRGLGILCITTLPALIIGFLTASFIKNNLFNPVTVAIGLGIGGIAILVVEQLKPQPIKKGLDELSWRDGLVVGLFQCLALWPGVSRSAATILGGMLIKIERRTAAEFSFFAAVPLLLAATSYDLLKNLNKLQISDVPLFAVGFLVAFASAWFAIKIFIGLLSHTTLIPFGFYRIVLAVVVILVQ